MYNNIKCSLQNNIMFCFRNPNGDELPEWLPLTSGQHNYMIMEPNFHLASDYKNANMHFWNVQLPAMAAGRSSADEPEQHTEL